MGWVGMGWDGMGWPSERAWSKRGSWLVCAWKSEAHLENINDAPATSSPVEPSASSSFAGVSAPGAPRPPTHSIRTVAGTSFARSPNV